MEDFPRSSAPVVPGYDVGRCLGRGGTAAVWLATERSTGREYALKCFTASDGPDGGSAEDSARREVRVLSLLDHAHLVRAYGVVPVAGGTGGNLALTMDYAAGGSLGQLVASRGTLGPGETVTVLTPIAQALAYLHAQGFTHGDVSPGNVLFTAQGKPLLADVGVARMVAETGAGAGAGTEGFSDPAPVDAVRAGLLPERDLYSLAAVGWFCLTGHPPEPGTQRPPLPLLVPGVPSALAAALESGLQEDRRLRPSAAELAAAFYHSAPAAPLDLSVSVHPTVIPQLPTRRALPGTGQGRRIGLLRALPRRLRGPRFSARRQGGEPQRTEPADPLSGAAPSARGRATGRRSSHRPLRRPLPVFAAHSARPAGALRAAAATVALLGALVAAWAVYGTWTPGSVPGLPVTDAVPARDAGAGKGSAPDAGAPATAAAGLSPEVLAQLASPDPGVAVRGLARLRSRALNSGDFDLLADVNVPASAAAAADRRIIAALKKSGRVLSGFDTVLTRVAAEPAATTEARGKQAVVAVTARTPPYQELDAAGTVLAATPSTPEQRLRLVLASVEGRWRIQDILPADPADPAGTVEPAVGATSNSAPAG